MMFSEIDSEEKERENGKILRVIIQTIIVCMAVIIIFAINVVSDMKDNDKCCRHTIGHNPNPINSVAPIRHFDTGDTRIRYGQPGQVLVADPSEPTGLRWVYPKDLYK